MAAGRAGDVRLGVEAALIVLVSGREIRHLANQLLQLGGRKAECLQIDLEVAKLGQFQREHLVIPAGIESDAVVGENVGALLRLAHVRAVDARHTRQPKPSRRLYTSMAGNNAALAVDQDGIAKPELSNAASYLNYLRLAVRSSILGVGNQVFNVTLEDFHAP